MSNWQTQITYSCECMEGYGSLCGKKSRFILDHYCSHDFTNIFHKRHIEEENSKYELWDKGEYIQDTDIKALRDLLTLRPHQEENEKIDLMFFKQMKDESNTQ